MDLIRGIVCPLVTPMSGDGKVIDETATRLLADFVIDKGVHALFPGGTTGEGPLLTLEERRRLAQVVVSQARGRVPVVVHTGCVDTDSTIALTQHAQACGADAAAVVTPYFYTLDDTSLREHFSRVARSVPDYPIFLYDIPGNAKNAISLELVKWLRSECPNIVGIKTSAGDLVTLQRFISEADEDFMVMNGADLYTLPAFVLGACAEVSGNSNVFPEVFVRLYDAWSRGDLAEARRQQQLVFRIVKVMKRGLHLSYFKHALALRGISVGGIRAPLREPNRAELAVLERDLRALGLLDH